MLAFGIYLHENERIQFGNLFYFNSAVESSDPIGQRMLIHFLYRDLLFTKLQHLIVEMVMLIDEELKQTFLLN